MKIHFDARTLAAVAFAIDHNEFRHYLCGVYFERHKDGGILAVATDEHLMTVAHDAAGEIDQVGGCIMPVGKKAITALKHKRAERAYFDGSILTVIDSNGNTTCIEQSLEIDATFPDWRRIVPDAIGGPTDAGFSSDVMARIIKTAKVYAVQNTAFFRLTGEDGASPQIVYYPNTPHIFSITMSSEIRESVYPGFIRNVPDKKEQAA